MMDAERLADLYEIQKMKARYFRYMDTKQWAKWRELFTDDLHLFIEDSRLPEATMPDFTDADSFVHYVSSQTPAKVTVHHGHMPEIEFTGDRTATGVWAMFDWVDDPNLGRAMQGFGHYHEVYEKGVDDRWRIKESRLTRLRVNQVPLLPSEPSLWVKDLQEKKSNE